MRILLDSNVWRYISDEAGASTELAVSARKAGKRIVIAPAILYEALRMRHPALRRRLTELMTRPVWDRLMPEAYSEAEEFKHEVRRLRPQWLRTRPDERLFRLLLRDWRSSEGGFWGRARRSPDTEHAAIWQLDQGRLDQAREQAKAQRKAFDQVPRELNLDRPLSALEGLFPEPMPGWDGLPIAAWRLDARQRLLRTLIDPASADAEWIGGQVDIRFALFGAESWNRFWFYEVEAANMPRAWLRTAFEYLHGFGKVTDGTPVDAQLSTYLVDVDQFVSADKRLVSVIQRCRRDAPFKIAEAKVVSAGRESIDELIRLISDVSTSA